MQQMMSRVQNWPFSLQAQSVLVTLRGGMTMLIGMGQVTTHLELPLDITTHGHMMRMDILWHLMLTALVLAETQWLVKQAGRAHPSDLPDLYDKRNTCQHSGW